MKRLARAFVGCVWLGIALTWILIVAVLGTVFVLIQIFVVGEAK